jgi:hypothetical protein
VLRGVIAWIGLALLVVAVVGSFNLPRYRRLARSYEATTGQIIGLEPGNHQLVRYSYSINDREYEGETNGGSIDRPYQSLRVGDSIPVFYSTEQLNASSVRPPADQLFNELRGVVLAAVLFASFFLWRLWKWVR